jgi:hypothetical protein
MRGRKPVPTMLRELHGNPRKVPLPKFEPKPVGDLSEGPDWFTEDLRAGLAYALTNSPPGLLKRIDRGVLIAWVVAEDLHRQAAIAQAKVGLLVRVKLTPMNPAFRRRRLTSTSSISRRRSC